MLAHPLLQHLRIAVSFFLLPTFLFALSQCGTVHWQYAAVLFVVLHLFVYPSSHLYNNYHDNDTGAVSGLESPIAKSQAMLHLSIVLDVLALLIIFFISKVASLLLLAYILGSRAYSNRKIRIKKYPIASYIFVSGAQGLVIYLITLFCCSTEFNLVEHLAPAFIASLYIGSSYPITQIYQHESDQNDGIRTLSSLLGIMGTFKFSIVMYTLTHCCMLAYLYATLQHSLMLVYIVANAVPTYFFYLWFRNARSNIALVNYKSTMKMAAIASLCGNLCFLIFILFNS
jgi:4-hydroxybenzoate polyprenyltransferase